jgi:DNA-binding LytR/AlgR family response regulator
MIHVAICDDEVVIASQIENLIIGIGEEYNIKLEVDVYYSGETLEKGLLTGVQYDLLYLDIQMKGEDGITTAKNIRKIDENLIIIFVSSYDKYLMELFRLDVFEFIKKPISSDNFVKTFLDAKDKVCGRKVYFTYQYRGIENKALSSDIIYFESNGRQINIYLRSGNIEVFNGKLNDVEGKLSKGKISFLRIHQSYLVNYHLIKSRTKTKVTLINGIELQISEDRKKTFSNEYGKLLGGEIGE